MHSRWLQHERGLRYEIAIESLDFLAKTASQPEISRSFSSSGGQYGEGGEEWDFCQAAHNAHLCRLF